MLAKLHDECERKWLILDGVRVVDEFTSRYKIREKSGTSIMVEEVPSGEPPPGWKPNTRYLDRLLILFDEEKTEKTATFKVVGLYVPQSDGTEKYYCYGFTTGYLVNEDGKTIERL